MPQLVLGPLLRHVDETSATVWVETDAPCEVAVLGCSTRTFSVAGHHYALVICSDLEPGTTTPYAVELDGQQMWPEAGSPLPAPTVRTRSDRSDEPLRLVFGSCRVTRPHEPPYTVTKGEEVADFEEYTVLYREAWSDPVVRWVLSTLPTSMIFDDHDVHDDWNTSAAWREEMRSQPWWSTRIEGALMSYWLYQHLGNLSRRDLATDALLAALMDAQDGARGDELLRQHARKADGEADGGSGVQWSYRRDFGDVRLLVVDSRGGRVLEPGNRSMVDEDEWAWIVEQTHDVPSHLLIASSLPILLPPAIHGLESWNEAVCDGAWGPRWARWGERIRQGADLEHWAAFRRSFERLMRLVQEVGSGQRGPAPTGITFLGGDVHFSYLARAHFPPAASMTSVVHQAVCSPVRNPVNRTIQVADRFARTPAGRAFGRLLMSSVRLPKPDVEWRVDHRPRFDNEVAALEISGPSCVLRLERAIPGDPDETLEVVLEERLT